MKKLDAVTAGIPAFAYMFTVGSIGFWLPLYVQEVLGYSHSQTEYLATAYFISLSLGGLVAGAWTDRSGKPHIIASLGLWINTLSIILMSTITNFYYMILARILQGIGLSTAIPVALGSLSLIAGESRGVGLMSLFMSTGMAVGSLVGGTVIYALGYTHLFTLSALVSGLGAIFALAIRPSMPEKKPPILRILIKYLRGKVLVVLGGIFMRQTLATGVYAILAVILRIVLNLSLLETAAILTVNPIVQGALSMYIANRVSRKSTIYYPIGIGLTGAVFFLLSYSYGRPELALASMIVQGLGFALVNISGNYLVITALPQEIRYTASSLFNFFFNLGWISGTLVAGIALGVLDPITWLKLSGMLLVILSVVVYLGLSKE